MPEALTDNSTTTATDTTTDSAPATALEAVTRAAARAESDSSSGSSASTGAAASATQSGPSTTATAATAATTDKTPKPTGEAPESRIEAAVKNARAEGEKALTALQNELGWAKGFTKQDVEQAVSLVKALNANPKAFLEQLQKEVQSSDLTDPEPALVSQDGKYRTYDADGLRKLIANTEQRVKSALLNELKPTVEHVSKQREEAEKETIRQQSKEFAIKAVNEIKALPWFDEKTHGPKIMAKLNAMPPEEQLRYGGTYGALMRAKDLVFIEEWPTLQRQSESNVESDLRRKAAASNGTVSGTSHVATGQKRPSTVEELARHLAAKESALA